MRVSVTILAYILPDPILLAFTCSPPSFLYFFSFHLSTPFKPHQKRHIIDPVVSVQQSLTIISYQTLWPCCQTYKQRPAILRSIWTGSLTLHGRIINTHCCTVLSKWQSLVWMIYFSLTVTKKSNIEGLNKYRTTHWTVYYANYAKK